MPHSPASAPARLLLTVSGGQLIAAAPGERPPRRGRRGPRRLAPYARLFATPGTVAFTVPNLVARLPSGMFGVATVMMLTAHHGSYALAGAVVAAGLVLATVAGPLIARLVDRHGQARVIVPAALLTATGHLGLLACVALGAPVWSYFCCQLLTAAQPNTGGLSRARWAHLHRGRTAGAVAARHTANAFEQAMDELCFMCGPVVATLLCTALFPEAGTLTAAVLMLGGTLAFAAQRRTEPPVTRQAVPGAPPLRAPGMAALLGTFLCMGSLFGAMEVVTIAFAEERGQQALAGAVLAAQAAGSAAAGLLFGLLRPRGTVRGRFARCVAAMALLMSMLPLAARAESLLLLAPVLLIAGMATAPAMVTGMTLIQRVTPAGRLNEGMTLAVAALLGGIATGSAGGGALVEAHGAVTAYAFPMAAACLAAAVAAATRPRRPATAR
ncbi:MFS transporter [Streptomyces sp. MP131-18]|uniref:MFS transporter n=1 Tax=Streptomyces sp. MP131-18 TaxID=1857892 RepID=UPI00097C8CF4|nr:MFS transporter [Streptomyces sp. MP131-18]ONK13943.1 H+ Antiporter protein [Streptomyces sp. MP131-18]